MGVGFPGQGPKVTLPPLSGHSLGLALPLPFILCLQLKMWRPREVRSDTHPATLTIRGRPASPPGGSRELSRTSQGGEGSSLSTGGQAFPGPHCLVGGQAVGRVSMTEDKRMWDLSGHSQRSHHRI
jgi:hypothetical protein